MKRNRGPKEGSLGESLYHEYSNRLDLIRISLLLFFFFQRPSPPVHRWNVLDFGWVYSIRVESPKKMLAYSNFFPSCSFISEMPLRQCCIRSGILKFCTHSICLNLRLNGTQWLNYRKERRTIEHYNTGHI